MGYNIPEKDYKAIYYLNNLEIYRERNKKYREKQKAIKNKTYIEPTKLDVIKIYRPIIVNF